MAKRYITYTRKKINDNCYLDPNSNDAVSLATNWKTIFNETPYLLEDWRFIATVEYRDIETEENINYFLHLDEAFEFTFITEEVANELLKEFWENENWYLVSVKDFIFTDNRVFDII